MPYLVNNASGTAADTDLVDNIAPPAYNNDPLNTEKQFISTVYAWATDWGSATIQLYIAPQTQNSQNPVVWFPLVDATTGDPVILSADGYVTFSDRFGQIKGEVAAATADTAGLNCLLFGPLF